MNSTFKHHSTNAAHAEEDIEMSKSSVRQSTPSRLKGSLLRTTVNGKSDQRLIVKQIVLENFKSYQGRQVIGPFHKRFTSVVGPNGSGKSNLIESLLFVFGKKASWMRLKKLEQLIHNSSKHQNIKKASVEVTFHEIRDHESEEYEVIPNTEFTVRRSVNKSSVSKYEVDDREVSHQEVTDLLKSKGIDLTNNRFLILQGEVEQISLMKPRSGDTEKPGLLEYLEDIIGSNQFKDDIEKKDEEYETLQNERREKGERMRIHEADLEKLNESKNLAIEYVRNEKQSYQIINIVGQIDLQRAKKEGEKNEARIRQIEIQEAESKEKCRRQMRENEDLIKEYKQNKAEIEKKEFEVSKYTDQMKKLSHRDEKNRQKLVTESENQTKIQKTLEELQKDYNTILRDSKDYEKQLPSKQDKLTKLTNEKDEEDDKLREMKSRVNNENTKFVKEKKDLEKRLLPIKDAKLETQQRRDNLQNRLNLISSDVSTIQADYERTSHEIERNIKVINEHSDVIEKVSLAIQAIEGKVDKEEAARREAKSIEERVLKAVQECKQRIDQARQSQTDNQFTNNVLKQVMNAQSQNKLGGIYGRLGDLAAIHQEFDCAMTTACGQLDNIVVETYDDAQNAVNFLRKEKIGKAQFIALDKIEQVRHEMDRHFQCPKGSQRLFDLIQFKDQKFRVAFYFAIRNTLVCDSIDLATEIGYGQYRHRVVTKRGELIESTGVMSGGGQARKGGMASELKKEIPREDLALLQSEFQRNQADLDQLRETIGISEKEVSTLVKDQMYLKKELEQRKFDRQLNEESLVRNQGRIKALSKSIVDIEGNAKERAAIQNDLARYSQEYSQLDEQIGEIAIKITDIEERINKSGGTELKAQIERCKTLNAAYNELQNEVNKMSAKLKDTDKSLKQNEREKKENQDKMNKIDDMIKELQEMEKKIEEEATTVYQQQKTAQEQLEILQEAQKKRSEQKSKIEAIIKEHKESLEKFKKDKEESEYKVNKSKDDQAKNENLITNNRVTYKEITKTYDFMQQLDEISGFSVGSGGDTDQNNKPQENSGLDAISLVGETTLEMRMEEERNDDGGANEDEEEEMSTAAKQKLKQKAKLNTMSKSISKISSIEVTDDIPLSLIEQLENHRESLKMQKANAEEKLKSLSSEANITTITEFKNKYVEFKAKKEEFERVKNRITELKVDIDKLKKERFEKFMSGFNLISAKLKETYQTLTNGGDAELELIDSLDPFSDGVNFTVRPPKKSWKQISKLSGGEKTLSSLSLVFALHYYKPTPLYFMDEIDAALDFKNVSIVGNYIQERTKNAQFIIISLRNNMFELANKLVGVYKTYDATKTIAIIPELINSKIAALNNNSEAAAGDKDQDEQDPENPAI